MLEYPRKGVWSIGFVTGFSKGEVQGATKSETINVFVPTTPNPTSGYLLFVPKQELKYLNMTVEEGVKLVVSAGIITPPDRSDQPRIVESGTRNLSFEAQDNKKADKKDSKTKAKNTADKKTATKKSSSTATTKKVSAKKAPAKTAGKKNASKSPSKKK